MERLAEHLKMSTTVKSTVSRIILFLESLLYSERATDFVFHYILFIGVLKIEDGIKKIEMKLFSYMLPQLIYGKRNFY